MNVPSWIILILVVAAFLWIILRAILRKKQGKPLTSCGGACGNCPMRGSCHSPQKTKDPTEE
ncbi:MAG: FeoB-associated Cys-rich membrane protein [Oscillospiraceae bacterium]|nr:FeoB-associated Cys-rich membrane protein [Oscillospiraceae bacterium]